MEVNLISEGRSFSQDMDEEFQDSENIKQQPQLFSSNDNIQKSSFTENSGNTSSSRKRTLHISDDNQALEEERRRSELLKNRRIEYFEDFSEEDNISLPKGNYDEQGHPKEIVEKFLADSFENSVQMHGNGPETSKDQLQQNVEVEKMSTRDATKDGESGENANEDAPQVQNLNHMLARMNQQQDNLFAGMKQLEERVSNIETALYTLVENLRKRFA